MKSKNQWSYIKKMVNTWFISDTHFGHTNILEFEKEARPFSSLEEMHEVMIERWNSVVKHKDVVYHLGDFCFGRKYLDIASRLNGTKKLVLGNHDTLSSAEYLAYFNKLYGMIYHKQCVLSHMPVYTNGLGSRWFVNVHGHLHSKKVRIDGASKIPSIIKVVDGEIYRELPEDRNYFNVSCEQNNLTPIHWDCIALRIKEVME